VGYRRRWYFSGGSSVTVELLYAADDNDWSIKVKEQCDGQCVWPGCGNREVDPHHIIDRWHSQLRLYLKNGVGLCRRHHTIVEQAGSLVRRRLSILIVGQKTYSELMDLLQTTSQTCQTTTDPDNGKQSSKSKMPSSRDINLFS